MTKLRDYQRECIDRVKAGIERGLRKGIVAFGTGLGKTVTALGCNEEVMPPEKGRTLFIAPSRSLISQSAQAYRQHYPAVSLKYKNGNSVLVPGVGVVMGSVDVCEARIIVGSSQTLVDKSSLVINQSDIVRDDLIVTKAGVKLNPTSKRTVLVSERVDKILLHGLIDLVLFDECHHAVADGSIIILTRLDQVRKALGMQELIVIGFTATPVRADGRGLNNIFQVIYDRKDFAWGQRNGFLVPFAVPYRVILKSQQMETSLNKAFNWADQVVESYIDLANDRYAIAFTGAIEGMSGVAVSKELAEKFNKRGIPAFHTDATSTIMPNGVDIGVEGRGEAYEQYRKGTIRIMCSYGVGLEGLDLPRASCLLWMRATASTPLMTQAVGRILRLFPEKENALIIDFTSKDFELDPIGTIAGFKVDPFAQQYVEMEDPEEDDETISMPKGMKAAAYEIVSDREYKVTQILSKQRNDWFSAGNDEMLSLGLGEETLFCIPADYGKSNQIRLLSDVLYRAQSGEECIYTELNPHLMEMWGKYKNMDEKDVEEAGKMLAWASSFYSNYSIWSVKKIDGVYKLKQPRPLLMGENLELLLAEIGDYIVASESEIFSKKGKSWKSGKPSEAQLRLLSELGVSLPEHGDKKGMASKLISHHLALKPIKSLMTQVEQRVAILGVR